MTVDPRLENSSGFLQPVPRPSSRALCVLPHSRGLEALHTHHSRLCHPGRPPSGGLLSLAYPLEAPVLGLGWALVQPLRLVTAITWQVGADHQGECKLSPSANSVSPGKRPKESLLTAVPCQGRAKPQQRTDANQGQKQDQRGQIWGITGEAENGEASACDP